MKLKSPDGRKTEVVDVETDCSPLTHSNMIQSMKNYRSVKHCEVDFCFILCLLIVSAERRAEIILFFVSPCLRSSVTTECREIMFYANKAFGKLFADDVTDDSE